MIRVVSYVTVIIWLVGSTSCHDLVSPCPDIFQYEPNIEEDFAKRWYGVITLQTADSLHGLWIDIILTNKADSLGNWYGRVTSRDNTEFSIQDSKFTLEAGKRLEIRFYTQYRDAKNVPALRAIRLNGREICSNSPLIPQPPRKSLIPIHPPITRKRHKMWTEQCSMRDKVNALVTAGKRTKEGDWPWHIAIYHNEHEGSSSSIRYKCGGSLISDSHVLTAAHCLINKVTSRTVEIRSINIYLGTHNLKTFSEGVQFKLVDRLTIHPDYNAQTQYRDIAVLKLNSPADFTAAVWPVCLWPEDKVDLSNAAGKNGSVVGWGYDEYGLLADELMLAELPIVSQTTCLWSHAFYQRYTNDFTFCAGLLQGTSVCNGDSGGGMVLKLPTIAGTEEWFLRGIVSFSPAAGNTRLCDPSRYVIFTDVAKYLDWIKDTVSQDM